MRLACFLFFLSLALAMGGCGEPAPETVPEDLLDRELFTRMMVDVQLVEGMKIHKLGPKRERNPDMEAMYGGIFEKHGVSQADFESTYNYYKGRPAEMELIYEQVLDSLSKLDVKVKKAYNTPKNRVDTTKVDTAANAALQIKLKPSR